MARKSRGRKAVAEQLGLVENVPGSRKRLPSDSAILVRIFRRMVVIIGRLILTFVIGSVTLTLLYRFVDPPITPLMLIRPLEGVGSGHLVGISKEWVDIDELDPDIIKGVIAAEDARFFEHRGVDWEAVDAARTYNEKHKGEKVRGASTITMQCARNVFLWQGRNYLRKGLELYFAYLIEALWGKKRILEIYLNMIEWGDGVYGVQAATSLYFGGSATKLTERQAALLAAVLPNPRLWSPATPTAWINKRANSIIRGIHVVSLKPIEPGSPPAEKAKKPSPNKKKRQE